MCENDLVLKELTIIVVTKNNVNGLERTLESLITIPHCQIIVQDSESNDNSRLVAESFCLKNPRLRYFSESDFGIFDGMNRGIAKTQTKYVWFINAGDLLLSNSSAVRAVNRIHDEGADWLVGGSLLADVNYNVFGYWQTPTFPKPWRRLGIQSWCQQSTLYSTEFLRANGSFDKKSLIADWSTALSLEIQSKPILMVEPISIFLTGGISSRIEMFDWIKLHTLGRQNANVLYLNNLYFDYCISFIGWLILRYPTSTKLLLKWITTRGSTQLPA